MPERVWVVLGMSTSLFDIVLFSVLPGDLCKDYPISIHCFNLPHVTLSLIFNGFPLIRSLT